MSRVNHFFFLFFITSATQRIRAYPAAYIGAITHAVSGVPGMRGSAIWNASLMSNVCIINAPRVR